MGFSFLAWNVERFKATSATRIKKVADHILDQDPDLICILEFMGKSAASDPTKRGAVRKLISEHLPKYDFGLTDSRNRIEILVGWKRSKFDQVLSTQRREFDVGNPFLRPGSLVSVRQKGESFFHNLLFLHTDSGTKKKDFDNRQTMFKRIWKLKKGLAAIDIQKGKPRFIVLGDLNTMGRGKVGALPKVTEGQEIQKLKDDAVKNGMRMLDKSDTLTFNNLSLVSNLDHVIASDDVTFDQWFRTSNPGNVFEVDVQGWVNLSGAARNSFINTISDHSSLWAQVS